MDYAWCSSLVIYVWCYSQSKCSSLATDVYLLIGSPTHSVLHRETLQGGHQVKNRLFLVIVFGGWEKKNKEICHYSSGIPWESDFLDANISHCDILDSVQVPATKNLSINA